MENKEMQAAPKKGVIRRIIHTLFSFYPVLMPVVLFCILFNAIFSAIPAVFMQNIICLLYTSKYVQLRTVWDQRLDRSHLIGSHHDPGRPDP